MLSYFDVDGCRLSYEELGSGPPLVLIHGSLSDFRAWRQQLPVFSARYRTVAPSLRHCYPEQWDGRSDDFTVEQHAHDIAAFIGERLSHPVHLVGHSRGGAVAVQVALRHPERVRTLVLADPGGFEALLPDTAEGRELARESEAMFRRLRADLAMRGPLEAARTFVDALGGAGTWDRRPPEQRQMLLDNIATGPACAERPHVSRDALSTLPGPILLLTGERSPRRYGLMLTEMARINPRVTDLLTIPDAAHAMQRDNAAGFNDAVMQFLQRHSA